MNITDTIAAISTPRGKGGIAVIRVSGAGVADILRNIFIPMGKSPVERPRHATLGKICRSDGEVLDEGLVTFFAAPHSFTGEDVAEIACHGGLLLTETVLATVLAAGARPAEAGEFTARAMLHGKMDLAGAEALGALLEADTAGRLALARGGMEGRLSEATRRCYQQLSGILADAYAKIDFPDEDLNTMSREELMAALAGCAVQVRALADTWQSGRAVAEGIDTVICGPVNAGKSTLYNALVGREAAIVTDIAGTTRDVLTETVALGRLTLRLSDTAGLRDATDAVEQIGISRAEAALDGAELIFAVLDGSRAPDADTEALLSRLLPLERRVVVVLNKQDASCAFPEKALEGFSHVVRLSAAKGEIAPLISMAEGMFLSEGLDLRHDAVVANARQYAALDRAAVSLHRAVEALRAEIPLDAACIEAELAMSALGEVDGRAVDEDIVADIFSHFCVGK
ncbi:MAG: tRNA uridine-5-carboxymethylaminomethyl(34) synthesis GTPase MnmE [Ruminococcaceae bacterium]|nr:tRNA uridine-5-carboxymethylaminomethyl(34) synthesis GTPase MnmE [Oscillospiraceae bacterium]